MAEDDDKKEGGSPTPTGNAKTSRADSPEVRVCPVCECDYNEDTPFMLRCESCTTWLHIHCLGIAKVDYERLEETAHVIYCPKCITEGTESQRKTKRRKNRELLNFAGADERKMEHYLRLRAPKGQKALPIGPPSANFREKATKQGGRDGAAANESESGENTSLQKPSGVSTRRRDVGSPVVNRGQDRGLLVKPPEAYMMFKFALQSANPDLTSEELREVAIREWRLLGNSEKRRYFSDADRQLAKYRRDCADFYLESLRAKERGEPADVVSTRSRRNREGQVPG